MNTPLIVHVLVYLVEVLYENFRSVYSTVCVCVCGGGWVCVCVFVFVFAFVCVFVFVFVFVFEFVFVFVFVFAFVCFVFVCAPDFDKNWSRLRVVSRRFRIWHSRRNLGNVA
jgi:hypothetical protein